MKITHTYDGIELDIELDFYKFIPQTYLDPGSEGYVDIIDVVHKEESIYEIISPIVISRMEEEIYEELEDSQNL